MSESDGHGHGHSSSVESSFRLPTGDRTAYTDILGGRWTFGGLSVLEWIFLAISTINITVTIGITIERMVYYGYNLESPDFVYASILCVNAVFCLFYVYNGVLREFTFEIVAFMASVVLVLCYCVFEYSINVAGRSTIKLVRMIISCIIAPVNLYLAGKVAWQFGWLEFRIVGASEVLQYMYRRLKAFYSLLRFDFQAAVSFLILGLENKAQIVAIENYLIIGGFILSIFWMVIGMIAVKREIKWLIYIFGILGFVEPLYIVGKITTIFINHNYMDNLIFYLVLVVGAIAVSVRSVLLAELSVIYKNFNNGLSDAAFQQLVSPETTALLPGRVRRHRVCCCNV